MKFSSRKMVLILLVVLAVWLLMASTGLAQQSTSESEHGAKIYGVPVVSTPPAGDVNNPAGNPQPKNSPASTRRVDPDDPTVKGKMIYALKKAYLSPTSYFYPMIGTLRQEMSEKEPPFKTSGDKAADHLSRYGINFLTSSNKSIFVNGVYPSIFKQNPHYVPSKSTGIGGRTIYALSRFFITQGDGGD